MIHQSLKHTLVYVLSISFVFLLAVLVSFAAHVSSSDKKVSDLFNADSEIHPEKNIATIISTTSLDDDTPPPPTTLSISNRTDYVVLSWDIVKDTSGIAKYELYRDGNLIARQAGAVYNDKLSTSSLANSTYYVKSVDGSGNESAPSNFVTVFPVSANDRVVEIKQVAMRDVGYTVMPAIEAAFCEKNIRKTPVGFMSVPLDGGYFHVTAPDGTAMNIEPGHLPLENGVYQWEAVARDGYQSQGVASGEFVLLGDCTNVSTVNPYLPTKQGDLLEGAVEAKSDPLGKNIEGTTTIASSSKEMHAVESKNGQITSIASSTKNIPTLDDAIVTRIYDNNKLVENGGILEGEVELRVVAQDADSVTFIAVGGGKEQVIGEAELDQFLSRPDEDVWSYFWKTSTTPNDEYKVYAVLSNSKGKRTESVAVSILLQNHPPFVRDEAQRSSTTLGVDVVEYNLAKDNILTKVISPDQCVTPEECRVYCSNSDTKKELCKNFANEHVDLDTATSAIQHIAQERVGARQFRDGDDDGVSDFDERNIFFTDPELADSDHDGVNDGNELLARTNPLGDKNSAGSSSVPELILTQDPKSEGEASPDVLVVNDVIVAATATSPTGEVFTKQIAFHGKAMPNSFVTLYIFSSPIVVTVKTDAKGEWDYTLERELPDGAHQVYSTMTDAGGKILAKSEPLPFLKQAAAISVGSEMVMPRREESPSLFSKPTTLILIALLVGILGIVLSVLGFLMHVRQERTRHA